MYYFSLEAVWLDSTEMAQHPVDKKVQPKQCSLKDSQALPSWEGAQQKPWDCC
jgi:hypothetical protein